MTSGPATIGCLFFDSIPIFQPLASYGLGFDMVSTTPDKVKTTRARSFANWKCNVTLNQSIEDPQMFNLLDGIVCMAESAQKYTIVAATDGTGNPFGRLWEATATVSGSFVYTSPNGALTILD